MNGDPWTPIASSDALSGLAKRQNMMLMEEDGNILVAAATCPPAAVIENLFKTLLRVRQAEFESKDGVLAPDAWDVTAGGADVPIDVSRRLSDTEFASAFQRWRKQWVESSF